MILLDRQFGLTAVEVEHYFNKRAELGFELTVNLRAKRGESEWAPFRDEDEWELAWFLMKNLGQTKVNELLKLSFVSK